MTEVSTFLLFLRVGFSLAVVLGMIWGVARFAKRKGALAPRPSGDTNLDVVARRQLGRRGASLLVVEARNRSFLVGVTDTTVSLVAELDAASAPAAEVVAAEVVAAERPAGAADTPGEAPAGGVTVVADPADATAAPRRESLVDALRDLTVRR
jgi:flagellar protein FliO/FliZ